MPKLESKLVIENCIQDLRINRDLTQQELADAVNVTRLTIIALEKGKYNPSLELAFKLAKYFKVNIHDIFFV